jgi:hypothetical protein
MNFSESEEEEHFICTQSPRQFTDCDDDDSYIASGNEYNFTQPYEHEDSNLSDIQELQTSSLSYSQNVPAIPIMALTRTVPTRQMAKLLRHQRNQTKLTSWLGKSTKM